MIFYVVLFNFVLVIKMGRFKKVEIIELNNFVNVVDVLEFFFILFVFLFFINFLLGFFFFRYQVNDNLFDLLKVKVELFNCDFIRMFLLFFNSFVVDGNLAKFFYVDII